VQIICGLDRLRRRSSPSSLPPAHPRRPPAARTLHDTLHTGGLGPIGHAPVLGELELKVDGLYADELKRVVDERRAELLETELEAEKERRPGFAHRFWARAGVRLVGAGGAAACVERRRRGS
jgi:hypothetical protein